MMNWVHIAVPPAPALLAQLLIGLINGAFYAMLSLGLAVIVGLLNIINFTHGSQYMLGAFCAYLLLNFFGIGYWPSLIIAPIVVGAFGILLERLLIRHVYKLDHLYGLLLTFGIALIVEGLFRQLYGATGKPYDIPDALSGGQNLGFMFLPIYRAWGIVAGYALGLIEGLTKVFYPEASSTAIFVIMVIVLLVKPSGLFGRGI